MCKFWFKKDCKIRFRVSTKVGTFFCLKLKHSGNGCLNISETEKISSTVLKRRYF